MTAEDDKLPDYPTRDSRSAAYEVARTAIDAATAAIPGASYLAGTIIERFVAAPLQQRRDDWFAMVGSAIQDLQTKTEEFDPSYLAHNDDFVTAVFEATQSAMKTKNKEKLQALRNAVLNVAAGLTLDDVLRSSFFGYIDRFTAAHLVVLRLLHNPSASPEMVEKAKGLWSGSQMSVLRAAVPAEMVSEPVLNRILSDLGRDGLADTGAMSAMGTSGVFLAKRTTASGDAFLRFIDDPLAS